MLGFLGQEGVTLEGVVEDALELLGETPPVHASWPATTDGHRPGILRGLFAGGSLSSEAAYLAEGALGRIGRDEEAVGHRVVDYGADEYTRGRAHPMIDQRFRLQRLEVPFAIRR